MKLTIFICFVLLVLGGMLKVQYAQEQIDAMIQGQGAELRWYRLKLRQARLQPIRPALVRFPQGTKSMWVTVDGDWYAERQDGAFVRLEAQ